MMVEMQPGYKATGQRRRTAILAALSALIVGPGALFAGSPACAAVPAVTTQDEAPVSASTTTKETADSWMPGVRMTGALQKVVNAAVKVQAQGYRFVDSGCFFGTYLARGEQARQTFDLKAGVPYAVLAGSDSEDVSLKLQLFTETKGQAGRPKIVQVTNGVAMSARGGKAALQFTPPRTGRYRIDLVLDKQTPAEGSFCSMTVLQKGSGGTEGNLDSLRDVCGRVLRACSDIALKQGGASIAGAGSRVGANAAAVAIDAAFHRGGGTWALYGWILSQGTTMQSDAGYLGSGDRVLLALSDDEAGDIDLHLLDDNGRVIAGETNVKDPRPQFRYKTNAKQRYALEVYRDPTGENPSLVVAAVLDIGNNSGAADVTEVSGSKFTGTWHDTRPGYEEAGRLNFVIAEDGTVSGTIISDSAGLEGSLSGKLDRATGAIQFTFAWANDSKNQVRARGSLQFQEDAGRLSGTLNMTTAVGRAYAEAAVELKRSE